MNEPTSFWETTDQRSWFFFPFRYHHIAQFIVGMQYIVTDYEINTHPQSEKPKGLMRDKNHIVRKGLHFLVALPLTKYSCKKYSINWIIFEINQNWILWQLSYQMIRVHVFLVKRTPLWRSIEPESKDQEFMVMSPFLYTFNVKKTPCTFSSLSVIWCQWVKYALGYAESVQLVTIYLYSETHLFLEEKTTVCYREAAVGFLKGCCHSFSLLSVPGFNRG